MFEDILIYDAQRQVRNSELETVTGRELIQKHKILGQYLVICKYLKDLNKNGESIFSDAQGQLTL